MAKGDSIVRYDPALGLAPVFKPLSKSEPRGKLDVERTHGDLKLRWRGPDELGIQDETVLLAVLLLARAERTSLTRHDESPAATDLWRGLQARGFYDEGEVVMTTASFSALAKACGRGDGGSSIGQIRESLRRLSEVTLWVTAGPAQASSRLLSWIVGDDKKVLIAVNRRLAEGLTGTHSVQIDLAERQQLRSTTAQALHSRISSQIRQGEKSNVILDTVIARIWGTSATGATLRKRQQRVHEAFNEVGSLPGWTVERIPNGRYSVKRHKTKSGGSATATEDSSSNRSQAPAPELV